MSLEVTDTRIVYQRSIGSRWFCGLFAPFAAALFGAIPVMTAPSSAWFHERSPLEITGFLAFPIFISLFGLGMVTLGMYGAGPEDLIIDLTTRLNRFRRGFPVLARWRGGTLDDVKAVYVRAVQTKSATAVMLILYGGWILLTWLWFLFKRKRAKN